MTTDKRDGAARVHGILTAYLQSQAVFSALQLGIFEQLEEHTLNPRDLAGRVGLDERPTRALLIALTGLGLVEEKTQGYHNTTDSSRHLVERSPEFMGRFAEHQSVHFANFVELPESIRSNSSVTKRVLEDGYSEQGAGVGEGDAGRKRLIDAMRVSSRLQANAMAKPLKLAEGSTLVDLGCGSGDYSIAVARHHPGVKIIAVDYPAVGEIAATNIAEAGLTDQISVEPDDIMTGPLPACDGVLLSHVLDGYGRTQTERLVAKVYNELRPGGRLFIHSHMPDVADGVFSSLFGLILLINTENGEVYEARELADLVERTGFTDVTSERVSFLSGLIAAERPD